MNENEKNSPPPLNQQAEAKPLPADASIMTIFDGLLKQPSAIVKTIETNRQVVPLGLKLLALTLAGFTVFGVILGSFSLGDQLWAAPLKTTFGLLFSALICLPSLYIFAALTGTTLRLSAIVLGLIASLALMSALLLGFTPVLWVFAQSSDSVPFFGTLVLFAWLISLTFGTGFLLKMLTLSEVEKKSPISIWIVIFLLVTLQMSTSLRPIIGSSDHFLTTEKRFFLEHWIMQITR